MRFISPVSAGGTIFIRADGSIDPPTANITTVDNVTYTFTDNINESILVERDNIMIDGAGHTVQGTGAWDSRGIDLTGRNNVTIKNMKIEAFHYGIWVEYSSNNTISGNTITANYWTGILITDSSNNTIDQNGITTNELRGIYLYESSNNIISRNTIENHNTSQSLFGRGIELEDSSNNIISGNNITDNLYGIMFWHLDNNTISGNDVINNARARACVSGNSCSRHYDLRSIQDNI